MKQKVKYWGPKVGRRAWRMGIVTFTFAVVILGSCILDRKAHKAYEVIRLHYDTAGYKK